MICHSRSLRSICAGPVSAGLARGSPLGGGARCVSARPSFVCRSAAFQAAAHYRQTLGHVEAFDKYMSLRDSGLSPDAAKARMEQEHARTHQPQEYLRLHEENKEAWRRNKARLRGTVLYLWFLFVVLALHQLKGGLLFNCLFIAAAIALGVQM